MIVWNVSSNTVNVSAGWLADGAGYSGTLVLQPGGKVECDYFNPVGGSGAVTDDIVHTYVGVVDSQGHQVVSQSWSLSTVFLDGFWWGLSFVTIPVVIWFARKGARATPWGSD